MRSLKIISLFFIFIVSIVSCTKEINTEASFKGFEAPMNFPLVRYNFSANPVNKAGFELGKKLFYDGILSRDGSISCGSCHQQSAAFAHLDHSVSHGIDDKLGNRNAPVIQNTAWQQFFTWDGGVFHLDDFPINPITNPVEMDEKMPHVITKLNSNSTYRAMFKKAFNKDSADYASLTMALSQFMNMLVSNQSRYDAYIAGNATALSDNEKVGMNLFMNKCNSCHTAPLFTDNKFHNTGLATGTDLGRATVTTLDSDLYKFKTPTLRNVEVSYPYNHNGKMNTLDGVLKHYASDIKPGTTVDQRLIGGLGLTVMEQQQIIAFLKTLTDTKFLTDTRFSE
jgi:cytochrome c peroxidase